MPGKKKNRRQVAHQGNAKQGEEGGPRWSVEYKAYLAREANKVQPPFNGMSKKVRMDRPSLCHNDKLLIGRYKTRIANMQKQFKEQFTEYERTILNKDLELFKLKGQLTSAQYLKKNLEEQLALAQEDKRQREEQLIFTQNANRQLEEQLALAQEDIRHREEQEEKEEKEAKKKKEKEDKDTKKKKNGIWSW